MKYNVSSPPPSIYVAFKLFFDNAMVDSGADGASYGLWFAGTGIAKSGYPYGRGSPQA